MNHAARHRSPAARMTFLEYVMPPRSAVFAIIAALVVGMVGNADYADELAAEAEQKVARPQLARLDPTQPPRCPPTNAAGEPLLRSVAHQADAKPWEIDCAYRPRAGL